MKILLVLAYLFRFNNALTDYETLNGIELSERMISFHDGDRFHHDYDDDDEYDDDIDYAFDEDSHYGHGHEHDYDDYDDKEHYHFHQHEPRSYIRNGFVIESSFDPIDGFQHVKTVAHGEVYQYVYGNNHQCQMQLHHIFGHTNLDLLTADQIEMNSRRHCLEMISYVGPKGIWESPSGNVGLNRIQNSRFGLGVGRNYYGNRATTGEHYGPAYSGHSRTVHVPGFHRMHDGLMRK